MRDQKDKEKRLPYVFDSTKPQLTQYSSSYMQLVGMLCKFVQREKHPSVLHFTFNLFYNTFATTVSLWPKLMRILMCVNGPSPNVGKQCVLQALMCIWAICDFSLLWAYRKTCWNLHPLLVLPTVSLVSWFRRGNHLFDHGFSSQINACVCPFFVLSSPYESDCCFACVS